MEKNKEKIILSRILGKTLDIGCIGKIENIGKKIGCIIKYL